MKIDTHLNKSEPLQKVTTYLLAFILMSFSSSSSAIFKGELNATGCLFEDLQYFYLKELGIKDVKLKYKRMRMKNPYMRGYTRPLNNGYFLIALADGLEPSEIRVTLAHELVHVRQLLNGEIDKAEFEMHYMNRSFEDEAFRLSIPLAIKFFTKHKCNP